MYWYNFNNHQGTKLLGSNSGKLTVLKLKCLMSRLKMSTMISDSSLTSEVLHSVVPLYKKDLRIGRTTPNENKMKKNLTYNSLICISIINY